MSIENQQPLLSKRPYCSRRVCVRQQQPSQPTLTGQGGEASSSNAYALQACIDAFPAYGNERPTTSQARRALRQKSGPKAIAGQPVPLAASLLPVPHLCDICGAKKFQHESSYMCCANGEVKVATNGFPPELIRLFTSDDEDAVHFRTYARLYNNVFAFSSLGGNIESQTHKGIYVFKLHGQLYHFVPDLLPSGERPKFLQLYFFDAEHEKENRANLFKELRPDVIEKIMSIMERNPYARFFKSLREQEVSKETKIVLNLNYILDQRVYNTPTSDEVAAIWTDASASSESNGPHIIVSGKSSKQHRIMHYYGCYDPLQYPLLFPYGDCGWHRGLKKMSVGGQRQLLTSVSPVESSSIHDADSLLEREQEAAQTKRQKIEKEISCREYYAFVLQIRTSTCVLLACRLLQQFIVDMYVKIENTRLDFLRHNQQTIRADLYQGLMDTLEAGESNAANAGHRVILPPSFIGGPRDMKCRYLNAMALVKKFGKPNLFATMTCNPNWPEIKRELAPGEKAQNRPDLIARIFRSKLLTAKKKIMQEKIFGEVAAYIYVVEFQKCGLPHAHFLIILKPGFKVKDPSDFDKFVSTEIPSSDNPHLRKAVLSHMMHGPCGKDNPSCPCMKKKGGQLTCKNAYPKAFNSETSNNSDGYPIYKRRDTGEVVLIRGKEMNNRWVIPYNPYLLAFFDCHFNVEICSTIQAVKYLYKYVYKGHDRISFNVVQRDNIRPCDEIEQFQSGRWISPPEAAWRIFAFDLYDMYPSVMPLQVHLDNKQAIHFRPHENVSSIVHDSVRSRTPLMEFFSMNAKGLPEEPYLYSQFPEHYVWDSTSKTWKKRKQGMKVGRLTFASPSEGERFYLRTLLANVPGPKSFEDLQSVNGYRCATFKEAALKRGLIEQNDSVEQCLDEAVTVQMPAALRRLFVTLLIFCQPTNPTALWNKYYPALYEDYKYTNPREEKKVLLLTSGDIERLLEAMGKTLKEFGLQHLKDIQDAAFQITRDIEDALKIPIPVDYINARKQLNVKQKEAYKKIVACVKAGTPGIFFVDGPGGTGKTFLYCALYAKVRSMEKIVLSTATSGIAAANLPGGRTAHSRFKIPIDYNTNLTCNVPKQGSLAALLKNTSLIIWDEASMAHKANIHALDLLLRDLCFPNLPFGGKILVFGGDFRQVLPVVPHKTQREAVEASLVSSELWPAFNKLHLTKNMRAMEDPPFAEFLLALGDGKLQKNEQDFVPLPSEIVVPFEENEEPVQQLVHMVFPEIESNQYDLQIFAHHAILTPKHEDVDAINNYLIAQFNGEPVVYKSFDTLLDENSNIYPTEFLHTLAPGGMSPHELILKKDCPVILLRNIDPSSGLCNGTRLTCKSFLPNIIICVIATGYYEGKEIMLPRVNLQPSSASNYPFKFQRKQFPIKLSFAMTINKAQGQTLDQVGIYLRQPCFSHGQLYVALSRARKSTKVKVLSKLTATNQPHNCVRNLISFDILKRAGII